jgi:hypothetical protein
MQDFLLFKTFISPTLFIFIYYVGTVLIPLLSWLFGRWMIKNFFQKETELLSETMGTKYRFYLLGAFIFSFLCMEIFWRVIFEFIIAYFNMHDALMKIV